MQGFNYALATLGIYIQRGNGVVGQFEQVRGFAAWGGAGIKQAQRGWLGRVLAGAGAKGIKQQRGSKLCACVLH